MRDDQKRNIDDIARLAYVSRSVVSRVLNNRPNVSEESRRRVLEVIEKYNYRPNSTARSLATDRTYEIGILAPRKPNAVFANGFWSLIFLGISEQCLQRGYFVSLSMISKETEQHLNDRILHGHNVDGYVLIAKEVADQVEPVIRQSTLPTVLIGHNPALPDLVSVDVDNFQGGYLAAKHLLSLGHQKIVMITGTEYTQESSDREQGFKKALEEVGRVPHEEDVYVGDYSQRSGYEGMQKILSHASPPTAVFCASDAMAVGAMRATHEAGLNIPDQVAFVGFDDLPGSEYTFPSLSTIRQPIFDMGKEAANLLINLIEGAQNEETHHLLGVELIVRDSCGAKAKTKTPASN